MRNHHQSIPDRSRPGLPTTASGVAQRGTCRNYATAKHCENKSRKRGGKRVKKQRKAWKERRSLKWKRNKARNIGGGCNIFYNEAYGRKNGIGIVLKKELAESDLEVKRVSDRLMAMKLEINGSILNIQ